MNWFEKIKKYYDASLWTGKMVGNAVVKKKITVEQYKESQSAYYRNFDDHGRLLRLRRLEYALFGGLKCSELSKTAAASA